MDWRLAAHFECFKVIWPVKSNLILDHGEGNQYAEGETLRRTNLESSDCEELLSRAFSSTHIQVRVWATRITNYSRRKSLCLLYVQGGPKNAFH